MTLLRRTLIALAAVILLPAAGADPGIAVLERLFRAPQVEAAWFTPAFIEKVPIEQVNALLGNIKQEMGAFKSVDGSGHSFIVHLAHGDLSARLVLTDDGKIAGLLLRPAATQGSLQDHVRAIASLAGDKAVLVTRNDDDLVAVHADAPLAVGSAFKLAVLQAVAQAVQQKRLAWDQVVRLDPAWRSLPSGVLQEWPAGTPVAIETLADMMISVSDNTAADALIALAGRGAVETVSPRNTPFLTTREACVLKGSANGDLRARWLAGNTAARRAMLPEIAARPLPSEDALMAAASLGIEWHFSVRELAALLTDVRGLPMFEINPGLATRADWRSVAFKGGSETDCVNLSTLVVARNGARHAVIVTWNGPGASAERIMGAYSGMLHALAHADG
jgi:hypothetical protein